MYQIRPDDYAAFRCLAGACPQTCCAAWEIVVDPDAQDAYLRLQHPLAAKLRRVLRVDSEGDTYFAQTDGRCPFLCADGLCELQRTLGEQSLCRTCRDFPRWEVLLCDRVEQGLSPACPEAARRLLERSVPLRFTSMLLPDDGYVPGARERRLTAAVTAVRDRILALLARPGRTAYANLAAALAFARAAQRLFDRHRIAALAAGNVPAVTAARANGAGGTGCGVCVARAARCPLARTAAVRGRAGYLPAAAADGRAADMPRADNRLAARYGRARRPRCGLSCAVRRGNAASARLFGDGEQPHGCAADRARHARGGKRPRSPVPAARRAADNNQKGYSGGIQE